MTEQVVQEEEVQANPYNQNKAWHKEDIKPFVSSDSLFFKEETPEQPSEESVEEVVKRKNTNQFFGLYISDGRLKSKDNTLEWRFDIWQDLIEDLNNKGKIVFGFGFNEIFEIMKDPTAPGRLGREGLNEHVHNHLFTLLGRMGLIGLFIYVVFQFNLLKKINTRELFIFFTPLLLVSLMDTTMESVQFPLLYYVLISKSYIRK